MTKPVTTRGIQFWLAMIILSPLAVFLWAKDIIRNKPNKRTTRYKEALELISSCPSPEFQARKLAKIAEEALNARI